MVLKNKILTVGEAQIIQNIVGPKILHIRTRMIFRFLNCQIFGIPDKILEFFSVLGFLDY